jgi:hypothetical protein
MENSTGSTRHRQHPQALLPQPTPSTAAGTRGLGGHPTGRGHGTGIVQARCGHAPSRGVWGLAVDRPWGERWKPCYACGAIEAPVVVQPAGAEVTAAVAQARQTAGQPP